MPEMTFTMTCTNGYHFMQLYSGLVKKSNQFNIKLLTQFYTTIELKYENEPSSIYFVLNSDTKFCDTR